MGRYEKSYLLIIKLRLNSEIWIRILWAWKGELPMSDRESPELGSSWLTPMLLVANLANTKGCKKTEKPQGLIGSQRKY